MPISTTATHPIYLTVAQNLRQYRKAHGLSQNHMALVLGIFQPTYSRLELGETRIGLHQLVLAAEHFGVRPEILLRKPL